MSLLALIAIGTSGTGANVKSALSHAFSRPIPEPAAPRRSQRSFVSTM